MNKLAGKVALITRTSNSTGSSIAKAYAAEGAIVVLNYEFRKDEANKTVAEINSSGGKAISIMADISKKAEVIRLFENTLSTFGRLDILVNNASSCRIRPFASITIEAFNRQFSTNLLGPILAIQQAIKIMKHSGGSIINIGSNIGRKPSSDNPLSSAAIAALDSISHAMSLELGSKNIRVNSLNPEALESDGFLTHNSRPKEWIDQTQKPTPTGSTEKLDDISKIAVFLASDEAARITGESIYATNDYARLIESIHLNIN